MGDRLAQPLPGFVLGGARGLVDGDGRADIAVYQSSTGGWYALLSWGSYATTLSKNWGGVGYAPVPSFP